MFLLWCSLKIESYFFFAIKPFGFIVFTAATENERVEFFDTNVTL